MMNKAIIIGNLTEAPKLQQLPSGISVSNLIAVTNRTYKDAQGDKKEEAEFHRVVVYGKQAESCSQYLIKGQQVIVEGRLRTRSWEKDGQKHWITEIVAERVTFGRKPSGATRDEQPPGSDVPPDTTAAEVF